jgi:hypothetical protein
MNIKKLITIGLVIAMTSPALLPRANAQMSKEARCTYIAIMSMGIAIHRDKGIPLEQQMKGLPPSLDEVAQFIYSHPEYSPTAFYDTATLACGGKSRQEMRLKPSDFK